MRGRGWTRTERIALALVATLTAVSHLGLLGSVPEGVYQDEASIGYDAWAVAHTGHDQAGRLLPLFFESFGDWKSPVYHYLLVPFMWVASPSAALIRLPAAICTVLICALCALWTQRRRGAPAAVVLSLAGAATTPWLTVEGRLAFEVITLVLALVAALLCLLRAAHGAGARWSLAAGACLGLGVFCYQSGKLECALLAGALVVTHARRRSAPRRWWLALVGPAAAYGLLGAWALRHPGALTARLDQVSIGAGHPDAVTYVARFVDSYLRHVDPRFLLVWGDANRRHATGLFGLLLLLTLPATVAGVALWWRRRGEPLHAFLLLALVLAPVPAAFTAEGIPHALRDSPLLAVLLIAQAEGWPAVVAAASGSRVARRTGALLLALATAQAAAWWVDAGVRWPDRSAFAFDSGTDAAIAAAHDAAGGHRLLLDTRLGEPAAHALWVLLPHPSTSRDALLAGIGVAQLSAGDIAAQGRPGDVAVLAAGSPVPAGATVLRTERGPAPDGGLRDEAVVARLGG